MFLLLTKIYKFYLNGFVTKQGSTLIYFSSQSSYLLEMICKFYDSDIVALYIVLSYEFPSYRTEFENANIDFRSISNKPLLQQFLKRLMSSGKAYKRFDHFR
jgi:hypothetical protein